MVAVGSPVFNHTGDLGIDRYLGDCHSFVYDEFCAGCGGCCEAETGISMINKDTMESIKKRLGTDRILEIFDTMKKSNEDQLHSEDLFYDCYGEYQNLYFIRAVDGECVFLDNDKRCYINDYKPGPCMMSSCDELKTMYGFLMNKVFEVGDIRSFEKEVGKRGVLAKVAAIDESLDKILLDDGAPLREIMLAGVCATCDKPEVVREIWGKISIYREELKLR